VDFPAIALIVVGLIFVGTIVAAGGMRALIPPKAPTRGPFQTPPRAEPGAQTAPLPEGDAGRNMEEEGPPAGWFRSGPARAEAAARDDPADNFFSDEDDFAFREPDANRGPFSQREEDRDSLDDPDRNR
jgi:hypothetical protein